MVNIQIIFFHLYGNKHGLTWPDVLEEEKDLEIIIKYIKFVKRFRVK